MLPVAGYELLLDLVVNLPKAQRALCGLHRQLAKILAGNLERPLIDLGLDRPVREDLSTNGQLNPADLQVIRTRSARGPSITFAIIGVGTLLRIASAAVTSSNLPASANLMMAASFNSLRPFIRFTISSTRVSRGPAEVFRLQRP